MWFIICLAAIARDADSALMQADDPRSIMILHRLRALTVKSPKGDIVSVTIENIELLEEHVIALQRLQSLMQVRLVACRWSAKAFRNVVGLNGVSALGLNGCVISKAELRQVASIASLRELDLSRSTLPDLSPLAECKHLRSLRLAETNADDDFVKVLSGTQLDTLDLSRTRITSRSGSLLARIHTLRSLSVDGTILGDDAVGDIVARLRLQTLSLNDTKVTDALGRHLLDTCSIKRLFLGGTPIGDEAIAALSSCSDLDTIDISGSEVSAEGIRAFLRNHPSLTYMNVGDTNVSAIQIGLMIATRPKLHVEH